MSAEISKWNRQRIAFSSEGPLSEDPQIRYIAEIQRFVSQLAQGIFLGGVTGYAGWIYNDPDRKNGESLSWTFYTVAGVGAANLAGVTVYRSYRWCRDKKKYESWVLNPMLGAIFASSGPLAAMAIAFEKARKISTAIYALNLKNSEIVTEQIKQRDATRMACFQTVYSRIEEFTKPSCSVCLMPSSQSTYPSFYQALTVEEFSTLVCKSSMPTMWDPWSKMTSFEITSDVAPCINNFFNNSDPDYDWQSYLCYALGLYPPINVKVSPYNDTCLTVNASGIKGRFIAWDLCYRPEAFNANQQTICTTPAWIDFGLNYSANKRGEIFNFPYLSNPDQVNKLLDEDTHKFQLKLLGPVLLFAVLALFARTLSKKCTRSNTTPPIEMQTLTAEENLA